MNKEAVLAKQARLIKKLEMAQKKKADAVAAEDAVLSELAEIEKDVRIIELEERLALLEGQTAPTCTGDADWGQHDNQ